MSTTAATNTPLANPKKKARAPRLWTPGKPSKASALVTQWMRRNGWNVAKLARFLDCTWVRAQWIASGHVAPSVLQALALRDTMGTPIVAWREAA